MNDSYIHCNLSTKYSSCSLYHKYVCSDQEHFTANKFNFNRVLVKLCAYWWQK